MDLVAGPDPSLAGARDIDHLQVPWGADHRDRCG